MKKIFIISLSLFVFTLFSCSNSVDEADTEKETSVTVSGRVIFSEAADRSRTATSSFSEGNINWVLTAYSFDNRETPDTSKTYKPIGYEKGNYFKFVFPKNGTYLIEARGMLDNGVCAYGSEAVEITDNKSQSISVKALPQASAVLGNVRLAVNLDSALTPYIKKISVNWIGLEDRAVAVMTAMGFEREGNAAPSPEVEANIAKLEEWQGKRSSGAFNKDFSVSSGKALISLDGIFCGAHAVEISFIDNENRTVYKCKEMINVYSGFTTDSWHGSSKFISNGRFVLSKRTVLAYGVLTMNNYSPVLYTKNGNGYDISRDGQSLGSNLAINEFTFDSNGNVFYVKSFTTTEMTIATDKAGYESNNYTVDKEDQCNRYGILIDKATDDLYTYSYNFTPCSSSINDEAPEIIISKYEGFASNPINEFPSSDANFTINCTNVFGDNFRILCLTVYNGTFYIYGWNDYPRIAGGVISMRIRNKIAKATYESGTSVAAEELVSSISLPNSSAAGICSDMVYQDGYLYALYYEQFFNASDSEIAELACQGALLKIDASDGTLADYLGWPDENDYFNIDFSDNSNQNYALATQYDYSTEIDSIGNECFNYKAELVYTNNTRSSLLTLEKRYYDEAYFYNEPDSIISIHSVKDSKENSILFGPKKILAIKPKRLVIADNGVAFYTNDGIAAYKNKNRIVTVSTELDDFMIKSIENTSSVFEENITKPFVLNGSGFPDSFRGDNSLQGYYYNNTEQTWMNAATTSIGAYLCIPNID